MLVITRKLGENVVIGEHGTITIRVLGICGRQVRLGIDAPKTIPVHREEIYKQVIAKQGELNQKTTVNMSLTDVFRGHQNESKTRCEIH